MIQNFRSIVRNALTSRKVWLEKLFDSRRDIDQECGYPETIVAKEYFRLYERGDIAERIVKLFPEDCWADDPVVFETEDEEETEFEKQWKALVKQHQLYSYLHRVDELSGIGRYGVILLGLDDGLDLHEKADGISETGEPEGTPSERNLIYLRVFHEGEVTITAFETDATSPRYGLPKFYEVHFSDTTLGTPDQSRATTTVSKKVHWSRILHIADNRGSSEVYGKPRMKVVFNRVLDIRKVSGGSGEMFWKGGFPGLSIETQPGLENHEVDLDEVKTKEQMEAYMNGLQRYLSTVGMTVKSLQTQVADPRGHVDVHLKLIATTLGVPWRILVGSEAAQLASSQDIRRWNSKLNRRRKGYINPFIIDPFVQRLILLGVLVAPAEEHGVNIWWQDLNAPSDEDKARVGKERTEAIAKYVQSGASQFIPPMQYLTLILGMKEDEAKVIIEEANLENSLIDPDEEEEEE